MNVDTDASSYEEMFDFLLCCVPLCAHSTLAGCCYLGLCVFRVYFRSKTRSYWREEPHVTQRLQSAEHNNSFKITIIKVMGGGDQLKQH